MEWDEIDPASLIKPHLDPAENLVWVGKPAPTRFRAGAWSETVIGIRGVALGIAVSGGFFVALLSGKGKPPASGWVIPLVSLFVTFMFVKLGVLAMPRYRRKLDAAVYAVTDKRAIVLNGFGCNSGRIIRLDNPGRSFDRAAIQSREVKRRPDGSGDIVFDHTFQRVGRGRLRVEIGFFGVGDVDHVDDLLAAILPGARPMKFSLDSPF